MKNFFSLLCITLTALTACHEPLIEHPHASQQLPAHTYSHHTTNISPTCNNTLPRPQYYTQKSYYANDLSRTQKLSVIHQFMSYFGYASQSTPYAQTMPPKQHTQPTIAPHNPTQSHITAPETKKNTSSHNTFITEIEDQLFMQQQSSEWDKHTETISSRSKALQQMKNGNDTITTKQYKTSHLIQRYCQAYDINIDMLKNCSGTILQQAIHQEFFTISKQSAKLGHHTTHSKPLHKMTGTIANFTNAGIAYNNNNEIKNALLLADACWMLLDCVQAAGEGLIDGAYHLVDDVIHPMRTAQNIVESAAICGYYIGKVAVEIGQFGYLAIIDNPDKTDKKLQTWKHNFSLCYEAIQEKCSTLNTHDIVKETVSLGVQFYAAPKVLHGLGRLFKYAHKHTIKIVEMSRAAKANTLTTPEGIIVRIADSAVELMKNEQALSITKPLQVANMSEFFKQPFGQILLKKSQKTPYRYQNPIYKLTENIPGTNLKKNHFYYLDRLHGNHLEVFDHTFQCVGVYNLDGTFNQIKYDLAKKNGRSIRNIIKGKQ